MDLTEVEDIEKEQQEYTELGLLILTVLQKHTLLFRSPWTKKKKCKKAKWLSEDALQIAVKRREVKSKREKDMSIQMQSSKE